MHVSSFDYMRTGNVYKSKYPEITAEYTEYFNIYLDKYPRTFCLCLDSKKEMLCLIWYMQIIKALL